MTKNLRYYDFLLYLHSALIAELWLAVGKQIFVSSDQIPLSVNSAFLKANGSSVSIRTLPIRDQSIKCTCTFTFTLFLEQQFGISTAIWRADRPPKLSTWWMIPAICIHTLNSVKNLTTYFSMDGTVLPVQVIFYIFQALKILAYMKKRSVCFLLCYNFKYVCYHYYFLIHGKPLLI